MPHKCRLLNKIQCALRCFWATLNSRQEEDFPPTPGAPWCIVSVNMTMWKFLCTGVTFEKHFLNLSHCTELSSLRLWNQSQELRKQWLFGKNLPLILPYPSNETSTWQFWDAAGLHVVGINGNYSEVFPAQEPFYLQMNSEPAESECFFIFKHRSRISSPNILCCLKNEST